MKENKNQTAAARKIRRGYERLAFGGICDAVQLLFLETPATGELEKMDLFNVSEIRRPKQGGMEIRFFDRMKALECLERLETPRGGEGFYAALMESARAVNAQGEGGLDGSAEVLGKTAQGDGVVDAGQPARVL